MELNNLDDFIFFFPFEKKNFFAEFFKDFKAIMIFEE